jgi:hypothetical protein
MRRSPGDQQRRHRLPTHWLPFSRMPRGLRPVAFLVSLFQPAHLPTLCLPCATTNHSNIAYRCIGSAPHRPGSGEQ